MALNLYRRHRKECEGGHPEDSKSGEFEEGRRGWKRCACLIHASGTIAGKFNRKQTGKSTWEEAKAAAIAWEKTNWDGEAPPPPPAPPSPDPPAQFTISKAVAAFLAERSEVLSINTLRQNKAIMTRLIAFSEFKGFVLLEQWTPIDVREFRSSWKVGANTTAKNMAIVKSFFTYCADNEWLSRSPAKLVKTTRSMGAAKERIPFTDDELERMYDACDERYGKAPIKWSRDVHHRPAVGEVANYRYRWTGQDLKDFISLSVYTGLRISDVATFHADQLLSNGECHIRTTKTGRKVYTWIPAWLQERVRVRSQLMGPLIFGSHSTTDINVITDIWRRKLNRLWSLCGEWKQKPTPHRLRQTFARILLQKAGITLRDVAELLGDTENVVRKHYAAWVPERQERLTNALKEAFEDKPRPKLVSIC